MKVHKRCGVETYKSKWLKHIVLVETLCVSTITKEQLQKAL